MTAQWERPNPVRDEIEHASDPQERAELTGMIELGSLLSRVEPLEPPPDLAPGVMRAVRAAHARERRTFAGRIRSLWPEGRAVLPFAYAAAAGAAICFVTIQVLTGGPLPGEAVHDRDAQGTMTGRADADLARLDLTGEGIRGGATVRDTLGNIAVDVVFERAGGLELGVRFDPRAVKFVGISEAGAGLDQLELADGTIRWAQRGPRRVTVLLARVGSDPTLLQIGWADPDGRRGGGALAVPASR